MTRNTKIVKKITALFLVLLLSIDSLAAVVSDNDGSAFITKAEFDSLKNNFQSQLDQYNTSIDTKIDNAIASYLAGISVSDDPRDYWNELSKATNDNFYFKSAFDQRYIDAASAGVTNYKPKLDVLVNRSLYVNEWSNPQWVYMVLGRWTSTTTKTGWHSISLTTKEWAARGSSYLDGNWYKYYIRHAESFYTSGASAWHKASELSWQPDGRGNGQNLWSDTTYGVKFKKNKYKDTYQSTTDGVGAAFTYHTFGNGRRMLRTCAYVLYPFTRIIANGHTYKDFNGGNADNMVTIYILETGQDDNTSLSLAFDAVSSIGVEQSKGTARSDTYEGTGTWGTLKTSVIQRLTGEDYSLLQFGTPGSHFIIAIDDSFPFTNGTLKTISADTTKTTRQVLYYPSKGTTSINAKMSGIKLDYYVPSLRYQTLALSELNQETQSNIMNSDIRFGNGVRIGKSNNDGDKVKVEFKFVSRDGGNHVVNFAISNKKFNEGHYGSDADNLINKSDGAIYYTANTNTSLTFSLQNGESDEIWLNCYTSSAPYDDVKINDFKISNIKD